MTTSNSPTSNVPYSHTIRIERLPERGVNASLALTPEECQALTLFWKIKQVHEVSALINVAPKGSQVHVTGEAKARVTYECGITLEPFQADIVEEINARFSPHVDPSGENAAHRTRHDILNNDADIPLEPLEGSTLDIGAIMIEFLTLGLDPYPRKPDAVFGEASFGADTSPFAALAKWKNQDKIG
jgi:hypothetical protein